LNSICRTPSPVAAPPPWSIDELEACIVVKDGVDQKLAYVYYEEEPGRRSAAKLLTKDEARRIAGEYRQAAGIGASAGEAGDRVKPHCQ
jgi:hypothetical protein